MTIIIKPTIISKTISIKPTYLENLFLGALSANFPFLFSKINCIFSPLLFVLAQLLISSTILLALFLLPLFIFLIPVFRISKKYVNLKERIWWENTRASISYHLFCTLAWPLAISSKSYTVEQTSITATS